MMTVIGPEKTFDLFAGDISHAGGDSGFNMEDIKKAIHRKAVMNSDDGRAVHGEMGCLEKVVGSRSASITHREDDEEDGEEQWECLGRCFLMPSVQLNVKKM